MWRRLPAPTLCRASCCSGKAAGGCGETPDCCGCLGAWPRWLPIAPVAPARRAHVPLHRCGLRPVLACACWHRYLQLARESLWLLQGGCTSQAVDLVGERSAAAAAGGRCAAAAAAARRVGGRGVALYPRVECGEAAPLALRRFAAAVGAACTSEAQRLRRTAAPWTLRAPWHRIQSCNARRCAAACEACCSRSALRSHSQVEVCGARHAGTAACHTRAAWPLRAARCAGSATDGTSRSCTGAVTPCYSGVNGGGSRAIALARACAARSSSLLGGCGWSRCAAPAEGAAAMLILTIARG